MQYYAYVYGQALYAAGRHENAENVLQECLLRAPEERNCLRMRAAVLVRLDRLDEARTIMARLSCRISNIITSATGTIITGCSSGSTSPGSSGRGTIAALPLKIGMTFSAIARACGVHRAARVAGCTGAPPEALLRQLEQMGFRHVPELLRSRDP